MFGSNCDVSCGLRLNIGSDFGIFLSSLKTGPTRGRSGCQDVIGNLAGPLAGSRGKGIHALERKREARARAREARHCPESQETCAISLSQRTLTLLGDVVRYNFIITYSTGDSGVKRHE
jgi:hypothetical protein